MAKGKGELIVWWENERRGTEEKDNDEQTGGLIFRFCGGGFRIWKDGGEMGRGEDVD